LVIDSIVPNLNMLSPCSSEEAWKGVFLDLCILKVFFQHFTYEKIFNSFSIPFGFRLNLNSINSKFKLHCNVVQSSISCSNELMCFMSRTFKNILIPQGCLLFPYFSNDLNLDANKEDLLHVTNCKSYQFILWLKFIYIKLFQHFMMSLTFENVLSN
jgi:hypothetical protein